MLEPVFENKKSENTGEKCYIYNRQSAVEYAHYYTEGQGQRRDRYIRYLSGAADSFLSWANPEYFFYKQNCAAFLSQCLHAGGIPMNKEWHQIKKLKGRAFISETQRRVRRVLSAFLIISQRFRAFLGLECWDVSKPWREAQENYNYFSDSSSGFISGNCIRCNKASDIPQIIKENSIRPGDIVYLKKTGAVSHCLLISKLSDSEIYYCANRYTRYDMELSEGIMREKNTEAVILCLKDEITL